MKIIRQNYIPFGDYEAINLFGVLFVRGDAEIDDVNMNHEDIHSAQIEESMIASFCLSAPLLFMGLWWVTLLATLLGFYLFYAIEWLVKLIEYRSKHEAYRNLSFEREAYENENNEDYLIYRKTFDWFKYL
jgi:hypothetical protein